MKKIILVFALLLTLTKNVEAIEFVGSSYIVMDATTHEVLDQKNSHQRRSVASISKIMSAIIAIENSKLDKIVTIDESISKAYGSAIYIHIGDQISIQDLLYGLMLRSGNDAAAMLATSVAGSIDKFVVMMNQKASEIGMQNTIFKNPSGLDEEDGGNISTSYDMALLMSYCMNNPIFEEIVSTKSYQRLDGNGSWKNKNKLLSRYEYCIGGKTGYTKIAKRTLVSAAKKNNTKLIIVTLNCGNDFEFHQKKYEQYFEQYQSTKLYEQGLLNYQDNYYFIKNDVLIDILPKDNIEVAIENSKLHIYKNKKIIKSIKIEKLTFIRLIKHIFKDCFNG